MEHDLINGHGNRLAWGRTALLVVAVALLGGCSTRNDLSFNPYQRNHGAPTAVERVEQVIEAGEQALDNLDARLENTVW